MKDLQKLQDEELKAFKPSKANLFPKGQITNFYNKAWRLKQVETGIKNNDRCLYESIEPSFNLITSRSITSGEQSTNKSETIINNTQTD